MLLKRLSCRAVRRVLWDYAADRLSEGPMETAERHLADCKACRGELESLRRAQQLLTACRQEVLPQPRSGWTELQNRLQLEAAASVPEVRLSRRAVVAVPDDFGSGRRMRRPGGDWLPKIGLASGFATCLILAALGYRAFMSPNALLAPATRQPGSPAVSPSAPPSGRNLPVARKEHDGEGTSRSAASALASFSGAPETSQIDDPRLITSVRTPIRKDPRPRVSESQTPRLTSVVSIEPSRERREPPKQSPAQSESDRIRFKPYRATQSERLQAQRQADSGRYYATGSIQPVANSPRYLMDTLEPINHDDDTIY